MIFARVLCYQLLREISISDDQEKANIPLRC